MNDRDSKDRNSETHDVLEDYMEFPEHEHDHAQEHGAYGMQGESFSASETDRIMEDQDMPMSFGERIQSFVKGNIFYVLAVLGVIFPAAWQLFHLISPASSGSGQEVKSVKTRPFQWSNEVSRAQAGAPIGSGPAGSGTIMRATPNQPATPPSPSIAARAPVPPVATPTPTPQATLPSTTPMASDQVLSEDAKNLAVVRSAMPVPERIVEKPVEKPVQKIMEKTIEKNMGTPVTVATIDPRVTDRLAGMEKRLEDLSGSVAMLSDKLRSVADIKNTIEAMQQKQINFKEQAEQNTDLVNQIKLLKQGVSVSLSELKHQRAVLESFVQANVGGSSKGSGVTGAGSAGAAAGLSVDAIVPGRAWLRAGEDEVQTVVLGDLVSGYGKVTKIDPEKGEIHTSSGRVLQQ